MKASIIIPTYNRAAYITNTVGMALRQVNVEFEVIVVDQTPSNETEALKKLCEQEPRLTYLHRDTPVGSSRVDLQACKLEYSIVSPK